ncbi:UbiA family prenyltransferase, partial [Flavobacteriaceae bacterium]|nr:UbiA family prenyltransferase [Flavobacteriaceae bacterium]
MSVTQTQVLPTSWVKNFTEITKLRLSVSVVFSSVAGYLLGAAEVDFMILLLLCIGGYCMVGASNVYNQIMERDLDSLMDRTKNRPIPAGRMSIAAALSIAVILTIIGISVLYSINP